MDNIIKINLSEGQCLRVQIKKFIRILKVTLIEKTTFDHILTFRRMKKCAGRMYRNSYQSKCCITYLLVKE
jgi:hypothetical protein